MQALSKIFLSFVICYRMTQTQLYKKVHVFGSPKSKLAQKLIPLLHYPNDLISFPRRWCQCGVLIQDMLCGAHEKQSKNHIADILRLSFSRLLHKELQPFKRTERRVYPVLSTLIILIVVFAMFLTTPVSKGKLNMLNVKHANTCHAAASWQGTIKLLGSGTSCYLLACGEGRTIVHVIKWKTKLPIKKITF